MSAQVRPEGIVEDLDREMTRALEAAVKQVAPGAKFDSRTLYRAFVKEVYKQCSVWENVNSRNVKVG